MHPNAPEVPRCVHRLTHGDLVILEAIQSSTAYAVRTADEDAGEPALLYLSAIPPQGAVEPAACLEVVEQGEWLGLRSPLLEGLFLQARKRAPNLVFFSPRLGVWEQWKAEAVYQGLLQQQCPAICLTSRQVPAITMSVRAWRVGCTPSPAPLRLLPCTPVQQLVSPDGQLADEMLPGSASGMLEYVGSVSSSLQDDALELSHHVVKGYVLRVLKWPLYLTFRLWKAEARSARNKRREAAAYNERRLQSAAWAALQQRSAMERHARHMIMLACQCWTRHHVRRLVGALREWHARATRSAMLERLCALCQRREWRCRSTVVLKAWSSHVNQRRTLRGSCEVATSQLARRRARRLLEGWKAVARAQRRNVGALKRLHQLNWLRRAVVRWHHVARHLGAARHAADAIFAAGSMAVLRGTVASWRALCARRRQLVTREIVLQAATARRLVWLAWCAWRDLADEAARRQHRVGLVVLIRHQQLAGRVLRRWLAQVRVAAALRCAAARMAERREQNLLPAAFAAWRTATGLKAHGIRGDDGDAEAARLMSVLQRWLVYSRRDALARHVLSAWRHLALASLQLQATAAAVARMMRRTRIGTALSRWHKDTRALADSRRKLLAMHQAARLWKIVRAWVRAAADGRHLRTVGMLAGRRLRFRRLYCLFRAWHALTKLRQKLWQNAIRAHSRALAIRTLACWRRRCSAVRAGIAALGRCRYRYEHQLLRAALQAMGWSVVQRHRVQRCTRQRAATLARGVLRVWGRWAARKTRITGFGRVLQGKWRRLVARGVLRSWFAASNSASLQLSMLEVMQAASGIGGAGRRQAGWLHPALFPHATVLTSPKPLQTTAVAGSLLEGPQEAVMRVLMASLGGVSITGGRGGAAATAAMAELLRTRLPTLARLATQPRRHAQAVFNAWQLIAGRRARLQAAAARLKARCRSLLLFTCFKGWGTVVADRRGRRAAAMIMARRLVRGLAGTCLAAWGKEARLSARLRRTCLKLLARRIGRTARKVLLAWRAEVRKQKERLQDKLRNKLDIRLALLHRGLQAWLQTVAASAEARQTAEKRHAATWMRFKRQVFFGWRYQTILSLQHLSTCSRMLQTRRERRLLSGVMAVWSTYTSVERQRREDWPTLCRVFLAWWTLVQPAGRAAAAAAAAAAELDARRLRQFHTATAAVSSTAEAAAAAAPRPPAPSSVSRSEPEFGVVDAVDTDGTSSPATGRASPMRYGFDIEERRSQAGVLAAQHIAWQQWYRMLQGGSVGALPGGTILLPQGMVADADVNNGEASSLRERLERLEEAVRHGGRGDWAREEDGPAPPQIPSTAISTTGMIPVVLPTVSTRAMTASCQPEPGPRAQIRQPGVDTSRRTCPNMSPERSAGGGMAIFSLPAAAVDVQQTATIAESPAVSTQPQLAAAAAPALDPDMQDQLQQPLKAPTSHNFSANAPPEPGPVYQIRQGTTTTVGCLSNKPLGVQDLTDAAVSSFGRHVTSHASTEAAIQQAVLVSVPPQATASSTPAVQDQQARHQQGPRTKGGEQHHQQGQEREHTRQNLPIFATRRGPGPGSLFQAQESADITLARASICSLSYLSPFNSCAESEATTAVAMKPEVEPIASHLEDCSSAAQATCAAPRPSVLPPPPPPLPPPGLARSSSRVMTASCAPEPEPVVQSRQSSGSIRLGRSSSGAISAVEPSEWGASLAMPQADADAPIRGEPPLVMNATGVPQTIQIIVEPYPNLLSTQLSSPCNRFREGSPHGSGDCNGHTSISTASSDDINSLASPSSLQVWSRRNTTDLVGSSEAEQTVSVPPLLDAGGTLSTTRDEGGCVASAGQHGSYASWETLDSSKGTDVHDASGPARFGAPPDNCPNHALPLSPIRPLSDRVNDLSSISSGETSYSNAVQLQPQTLLELGPRLQFHLGSARWESSLPPPPRRHTDGIRFGGMGVIDLRGSDFGVEGQHHAAGEVRAPLRRLTDDSLSLSYAPTSASVQSLVMATSSLTQAGDSHIAAQNGQVKTSPPPPAVSHSTRENNLQPSTQSNLLSQPSTWSSLAGGAGPAGVVLSAAPGPSGTWDLSRLREPSPPLLVQSPHLHSTQHSALLSDLSRYSGTAANGSLTGLHLGVVLSQPVVAQRAYSQGQVSPWLSSPLGTITGVPSSVIGAPTPTLPIGGLGSMSGSSLLGAYDRPNQSTVNSASPTITQQPSQEPFPSHKGGGIMAGFVDGFARGNSEARGLEVTVSTSTASPSTPTPSGTKMPEVEALIGELEARSRSAITSPHRSSLQLPNGAVADVDAGGPVAAWRSAKADTGGGAGVATTGRGAAIGLRLLDGIDSLLARATTLSAPGAPIFGPRDGGDALGTAERTSWLAEDSSNGSLILGNDPAQVLSGTGVRSSPEGIPVMKSCARVDLLDAALRRLEAASVNGRVAMAARPMAMEQVEVVVAGQDMNQNITRVAAAAERLFDSARAGASRREGVPGTPQIGAGLAADDTGGGRSVSRKSGGGSAADLLATFISGAAEVFRRQSSQHPPVDMQLSQSDASKPNIQPPLQQQDQLQQEVRQRKLIFQSDWNQATGVTISDDGCSMHAAPAAPHMHSQASSRARAAGQTPSNLQQQVLDGALVPSNAKRPDRAGAVHIASNTMTYETDVEVVDMCASCRLPACMPRQSSPSRCGGFSSGGDDSPQRRQQYLHQRQRHLERSPGAGTKPRHGWIKDDATGATSSDNGHSGLGAVKLPRNRLPSSAHSMDRYATRGGQVPLQPQPLRQPQSEQPASQAPGKRVCSDPLEEVLRIAQRRGNFALAATLKGLVLDPSTGTEQRQVYECRSLPCVLPPPQKQQYSSRWGGAASDGRSRGARSELHSGGGLDGSPSAAANGGSTERGMLPQSSASMQDHVRQRQTSAASEHVNMSSHLDPISSARSKTRGEERGRERERLTSELKSSPSPSQLPMLPSIDSQSTTTDGVDTSGSGCDSTGTFSAGGGTSNSSSICEVVANGFDPDPLHSPLRGVLGECQRLQSSAAQLEAEGNAVVRGVVVELSPRSAVEAALQAVLIRQQIGWTSSGSAAEVGVAVGRRFQTPVGRRG